MEVYVQRKITEAKRTGILDFSYISMRSDVDVRDIMTALQQRDCSNITELNLNNNALWDEEVKKLSVILTVRCLSKSNKA